VFATSFVLFLEFVFVPVSARRDRERERVLEDRLRRNEFLQTYNVIES
jgi:hypothetical protein